MNTVMKKNLLILLVMLSMTSFAQFPAPSTLEFYYSYIMIDEAGFCAGQWVIGPTYCSHFNWTAPDTTNTQATLDHYNLYYNEYSYNDTVLYLFASLPETVYEVEAGFIGELWVTAVYHNPEGESGPSNIIVNTDLPISVEETILPGKISINYDQISQAVKITGAENICEINVIDNLGKTILSIGHAGHVLSIKDLPTGLYIIEVHTGKREVIREKIIK
jgi:hypothetical protein